MIRVIVGLERSEQFLPVPVALLLGGYNTRRWSGAVQIVDVPMSMHEAR